MINDTKKREAVCVKEVISYIYIYTLYIYIYRFTSLFSYFLKGKIPCICYSSSNCPHHPKRLNNGDRLSESGRHTSDDPCTE